MIPQLLVNALITGSMYALAAAGMTLTYVAFKILNFAHGTFIMVGAYLFYFCLSTAQLPVALTVLLVIAASIIAAPLVSGAFIKPFSRQHALLPFVSTLALSIFLESIISIIAGVNVRSFAAPENNDSMFLFDSIYITATQIEIISVSIISLLILSAVMAWTPFGRIVTALAEAPTYLFSLGFDVSRYQHILFALSIFLSCLCGYFLGLETNLQPLMGSSIMIKAFAAMIAGGMTSIGGAVAAAFFLSTIESLGIGLDFGSFSIPASYRDSISLVIILVVLLIKPQGFHVKKKRDV